MSAICHKIACSYFSQPAERMNRTDITEQKNAMLFFISIKDGLERIE